MSFSVTNKSHPREIQLTLVCKPRTKDMVMLQHKFGIEEQDGGQETRSFTLCNDGASKGYSLMARLVGVPRGIACLMVLDGRISDKDILAPMKWSGRADLGVEGETGC